jgi:hypothetical protein
VKSKPAVAALILLFLAFFTWSVNTALGTTAMGRDDFIDWRAENTRTYYALWAVELVVLGIPALWFASKRMGAMTAQQDEAALKARGVGNLAAQALRGNQKAIAHLIKLLDDPTPAVRYQSARALALLDDKESNKELFRKVRYWDVDHKLALIDVLKRTVDLRAVRLLRELGSDRNPMVSRKAKTALAIVSSRSGNIDGFVEKRRKQAKAKQEKAARKTAKAGGAAPVTDTGAVVPAQAAAPTVDTPPDAARIADVSPVVDASVGDAPTADAPVAEPPSGDTPSD